MPKTSIMPKMNRFVAIYPGFRSREDHGEGLGDGTELRSGMGVMMVSGRLGVWSVKVHSHCAAIGSPSDTVRKRRKNSGGGQAQASQNGSALCALERSNQLPPKTQCLWPPSAAFQTSSAATLSHETPPIDCKARSPCETPHRWNQSAKRIASIACLESDRRRIQFNFPASLVRRQVSGQS